MSDYLQTLVDTRASVWHELKAVLDGATEAKRDLTADERATEERLDARLTQLDSDIAKAQDRASRNAQADEFRARLGNEVPAPRQGDQPKSQREADEAVLRSMVNGKSSAHTFRNDLTVGSATGGGNTVPTSFYGTLVEHLIENSAIRQSNVTVLTTDGGEELQVPKTTSHPTASIIAEGGTITESDPAFGQVSLGAFKYGFSVQLSSELEQDTGVDLLGYLGRIGGEALGNGSGAHFVTGTGTNQPRGVVTAASVGKTGAAAVAGVFTSDDLLDLFYSVIGPYRVRGSWLMSDAGIKQARKLKDGNDQYLWAPGLVAGEPNTLLGRPVLNDTNVADPAVAARSVAFGDMSRYFIRDVRGVRVERSEHFAFGNDLVTWRFLMRTDGDLIDETGAVKVFVGGAAS